MMNIAEFAILGRVGEGKLFDGKTNVRSARLHTLRNRDRELDSRCGQLAPPQSRLHAYVHSRATIASTRRSRFDRLGADHVLDVRLLDFTNEAFE